MLRETLRKRKNATDDSRGVCDSRGPVTPQRAAMIS